MEIFIKTVQFFLSLSLIIVLHELGHYLPAKFFKIKVEKFYLFFDVKFSLFKKKIGETVYGIGWLPLGGYVKIAGMIDESMDTEQMREDPKPWEFRTKPLWQRLVIMLGGVTVNFILAIVIYIGLAYNYGKTSIPLNSIKDGFLIENPILNEVGFKTGDRIISVDNKELLTYSELRKSIVSASVYQIERSGEFLEISLPKDFLGRLSSQKNTTTFELRMPFVIQEVLDGSLNKTYDLQKGDIITSINDKKINYVDELIPILSENRNTTIEAELLRGSFTIQKTLNVDAEGKLGIMHGASMADNINLGLLEVSNIQYSFFESIEVGVNNFVSFFGFYLEQFIAIFNPSTGAYKGLGGFLAIGNIFPPSWDWGAFWNTTAILSVMLGVLNLLPIPALDGGHAMFLIYEMISGRKPSDKFLQTVQIIGFIILMTLVIFANGNDIYKLFNILI